MKPLAKCTWDIYSRAIYTFSHTHTRCVCCAHFLSSVSIQTVQHIQRRRKCNYTTAYGGHHFVNKHTHRDTHTHTHSRESKYLPNISWVTNSQPFLREPGVRWKESDYCFCLILHLIFLIIITHDIFYDGSCLRICESELQMLRSLLRLS